MPRPKNEIPSYRRHKASGQAVVTLNGSDCYLGKWNTPESRAEYDRVVNEWLALGRRLPDRRGNADGWLVKELILAYRTHCIGTQSELEVDKIKLGLRLIFEMYGDTPAAKFGPVAFQAVRQKMVEAGLGANTIRQRLGIIKRMVGWGVANERLPGDALHRLQAVPKLRSGRNGVKPPKKVKPAPEEHIKAILPHLNPTVRAMVELQDLTGARPGEIRRMTTGQIDRSVDPWIITMTAHKTERFGKDRTIPLGPRAQAVVKPRLKADPDAPLFSPRETVQRVHEEARRSTRTDRQRAARRAKKPKAKRPQKPPGETYTKDAYRWAIELACNKAGVEPFTPNQIRHTAATRIRRRFGLEAAQVVLGHSKADTTQIYAEKNLALASEIARQIG